jgi:hypothetical protein
MTNSRQIICIVLAICTTLISACGKNKTVAEEEPSAQGPITPGPADPPYTNSAKYPSGLQLTLVGDSELTNSYPAPNSNPYGGTRQTHYLRVAYFIDLSRAPVSQQVAVNFRLSEYVAPVQQRGLTRAYIDPQVVHHTQQIRSGLGRALLINSAYRSPEHNSAVGGATYSRHIYGDAVDIDIDQNQTNANQRAQELFNEAQDVGVDFVLPLAETSIDVSGQQRVSWVHLDDRGF